MTKDDRFEWTEEERRLFEALPRERDPGPALRGRILEELRRRRPRPRPGTVAGRWRPIFTAAAAIVVFAIGVAVGLLLDRHPDNGGRAELDATADPARVQRLGTAYATAIASLAARDAEISPEAREVALSTLRGAAEHVARLPGHPPSVRRLLLSIHDLPDGGVEESEILERWF